MLFLRSSLVSVALCLSPALASAQRPGTVRPPAPSERASFLAARHLTELEPAAQMSGVFLTGDLDGDGDVDLLTCDWPEIFWDPRGIQTWLNGGRGDFELAHELAFDPWNLGLIELAERAYVADITGDGVLDLAYDRHDTQGIHPSGVLVHPGLGGGKFGAGILLATHGRPLQFLVGDCDGDGDADLLVHDTDSSTDDRDNLAWWRLEGGVFVSGTPLFVDTELPLRVSAMDVDGDGITDVLGGTFAGFDTLQVFRTVGGSPTLETTVPLTSTFHDINQRHRAGDIDGDGIEDLLLDLEDYDTGLFHLQVFLGSGSGFDPQPPQVFANPTFERPYSRDGELADWDGDGDLDFVSPTFSWLRNAGGAWFEPAGEQLSGWSANGNRSPMHVADLDGDGYLDALAHRLVFAGDGTFPLRTSVPPRTENLWTFWTNAEDWDGDGDLDLTAINRLDLNNADGSFVTRSTALSLPSPYYPHLVAWGDFDGDGLRDALASSYASGGYFHEMVLFTGTDAGPYVLSAIVPSAVEMPRGSSSGDLDGDGDVDVLATDGYWPNDGGGRFDAGPQGVYLGTPIDALDGDGDGDLDLVVQHFAHVWYLRNLGGLDFEGSDLGPYDADEPPAFLDADQDGDRDCIVARASSGSVEVIEQLPGGFAAPRILSAPGLNGPVGLADVDGDGRLELMASRTAPLNIGSLQLLVAWSREEGLEYGPRQEWVTRDAPLVYGDFDGDGDVEARGRRIFRNLYFDGPADGSAVQYGLDAATSGTGGRHPLLGSAAPVRAGDAAQLVITRGRGHASGVLLLGQGRTDVLDSGFRRLVDQAVPARSFVLDGPFAVAGAGSVTLSLPVRAALIGRTFTFQAVLADPGAGAGLSASNGLELRFGDWPMQ